MRPVDAGRAFVVRAKDANDNVRPALTAHVVNPVPRAGSHAIACVDAFAEHVGGDARGVARGWQQDGGGWTH